VLFIYGSVLLGALPGTFGVSWQGHLCGGIAGVLAAYLLSGPERKARELRKTKKTTNPYLTS
jgi:membrane associated rhomboid family serine protease